MSIGVGTGPMVTASVCCYNHARFVVEALESVKAQNYLNLHLVVVDDCSKDNSVEVIRQWLHQNWPNAEFIAHTVNVGLCRTLNEVLARARGKYIRGLAADDVWLPGTLAKQVEIMENLPAAVGVLYSDAFQINEVGEMLPKMFIEAHREFETPPQGDLFNALLEGNWIPAMTALVRLECFKTVGNYDQNLAFEDWDMWIRIARQYQFAFSSFPSAKYRLVSTSMVRSMKKEMNESVQQMWVKYLLLGWFSAEHRQSAAYALNQYAKKCYRNDTDEAVKILWQAVRCCCDRYLFAMLIMSICKQKYAQYQKLEKLIMNIKNRCGIQRR